MADFKLTQIWIYPIKSLGGISLSTAKVVGKGLQYDRRWMLVDETGRSMTQRVYPNMALFKLSLTGKQLIIRYDQNEITVHIDQQQLSNPLNVKIWEDDVIAYEVGPKYSEWFSEKLGISCKLVFFPEENSRPVDPKYSVNAEHVSLADAYPFLIIGQSSLDDLNARLKEPVPINRFRPNFVFEGGQPYEEDMWRNFSIGKTWFVGVKLCDRCVLTTVNQDTGERGVEPLKTLSSYRKWDNKVYFGKNLVALQDSTVSVGDLIVPE
jgi:uncharacterized protein